MKRFVKVDIVVIFWVMILASNTGAFSSLACLQRRFHIAAGIKIATSAFLKRFNKGLVVFLEACFQHAVAYSFTPMATPAMLRQFNDVLAIDSSLITLADALARIFPGPRNNKAPAAAKVNAVYSVITCSIRSLTIAAGTKAEVKFLKLNKTIAGSLLLFDLGYFSYQVFTRIDQLKGFFISRVKKSVNPKIVFDRHRGPGRTRSLVGMKLKDAVKGLGRDVLDVDVEVVFRKKRRPTKKDPRKTVEVKRRLRVVGVRHPETGDLHLYMTNIAAEVMDPDEVRVAYSGRWMVELIFAELKGSCQMRKLPSKRADVVRALILSSAIRLMVSRVVLLHLRRRLLCDARRRFGSELLDFYEHQLKSRTGTVRFVRIWSETSLMILPEVLICAGICWDSSSLDRMLEAMMLDPNVHRDTLFERLTDA